MASKGEAAPESAVSSGTSAARFGYFGGVFTPSILTILGVVLYMRFGWVVGQAGLAGTLLIVIVAHLISLATGLSIASIATNRRVEAGGAYFMISRSLGAPSGAAIGIPLFLGQALSITFYVVGFTESLTYLFPELNLQLTGSIVLLVLGLISFKSADLAIRLQYVIMALIVLSLFSFFMGGTYEPSNIVWWNPEGKGFSTVFAVFFPAVTGIMAGVSMSGDLKDPRRAIPRGTLLAIAVGFIIYMVVPIWFAMNQPTADLIGNTEVFFSTSRWRALVYAGLWGAALSSAIGSMLGAPRTLQALAKDGLMPKIFARGSGPTQEPRMGLLFSFFLAELGLLLGSLDAIAPVLTMFFLATYGVTNLVCALERWAATPSFRPTFRVPAWVSFAGALASFYVMSIINFGAMLAALAISALIFVYVERRSLGSAWGDARHGLWAAVVRAGLLRMGRTEYHPSNWRPNLVVFGGDPAKRSYLLDLGCTLVQERGIVSYFWLLTGSVKELAAEGRVLGKKLRTQFSERYPNTLPRVDISPDKYRGAVSIVQTYGLGTFEANTVMFGWPEKKERHAGYVEMLLDMAALNRTLLLVHHQASHRMGPPRQVDIWWGGLKGNGGMMLLLAFLLHSHDYWRQTGLRLNTVINTPEEFDSVHEGLVLMLQEARVDAVPNVILRESRSIPDIMADVSGNCDLAILGLRLPDPTEDPSLFFERNETFLSRLPTTIMVYSGRDFQYEPVLFDA